MNKLALTLLAPLAVVGCGDEHVNPSVEESGYLEASLIQISEAPLRCDVNARHVPSGLNCGMASKCVERIKGCACSAVWASMPIPPPMTFAW